MALPRSFVHAEAEYPAEKPLVIEARTLFGAAPGLKARLDPSQVNHVAGRPTILIHLPLVARQSLLRIINLLNEKALTSTLRKNGAVPDGTKTFLNNFSTFAHLVDCQEMQNIVMQKVWQLLVEDKEGWGLNDVKKVVNETNATTPIRKLLLYMPYLGYKDFCGAKHSFKEVLKDIGSETQTTGFNFYLENLYNSNENRHSLLSMTRDENEIIFAHEETYIDENGKTGLEFVALELPEEGAMAVETETMLNQHVKDKGTAKAKRYDRRNGIAQAKKEAKERPLPRGVPAPLAVFAAAATEDMRELWNDDNDTNPATTDGVLPAATKRALSPILEASHTQGDAKMLKTDRDSPKFTSNTARNMPPSGAIYPNFLWVLPKNATCRAVTSFAIPQLLRHLTKGPLINATTQINSRSTPIIIPVDIDTCTTLQAWLDAQNRRKASAKTPAWKADTVSGKMILLADATVLGFEGLAKEIVKELIETERDVEKEFMGLAQDVYIDRRGY